MAFIAVAKAVDVVVGRATFVEARGVALALFNAGGGRFHACGALCPHQDGPLSEGWLEADAVVCPWHGFDFDLRTGVCGVDPDLAIAVYPARLVHDVVQVDVP